MKLSCFAAGLAIVCLAFAASASAADWQPYDDFSSGSLDTTKWSEDALMPGAVDVADNQMQISFTQPPDTSGATAQTDLLASFLGVRADMQLLATSTAPAAGMKMLVSLNEGLYDAEFGLWRDKDDQTALHLVGYFQNNQTVVGMTTHYARLTFSSEPVLDLAILVSPDQIDFMLDGTVVSTYSNQDGIGKPPYSIDSISFLARTSNVGGFVDARIDNVQVAVPEPASLALLSIGGLMLMRRKMRRNMRRP